jgi:hypothetical protein
MRPGVHQHWEEKQRTAEFAKSDFCHNRWPWSRGPDGAASILSGAASGNPIKE